MKKFTKQDINTGSIHIENNLYATLKTEADDDSTPPWKREDGHGDIYEVRPDYVCEQGGPDAPLGTHHIYDMQESYKIALNEKWGVPNDKLTPQEQAREAVQEDYDRMQAWVNDEWRYVNLVVSITDSDGTEIVTKVLGGIEDDNDDYILDTANEMLEEAIAEVPENISEIIKNNEEKTEKLKSIMSSLNI